MIGLARGEIWVALHLAAMGQFWAAAAARRLSRRRGKFSGNAAGGVQ